MGEFRIDLTLVFNVPDDGLTVNGLVHGLKEHMPRIHFAIMEALFSGIEERAIERMRNQDPGRFVLNGHQRNQRQFRTSLGLFRYRLAQVWDGVEKKTLVPLKQELSLPAYRQCLEESLEASMGLVVHLSYRRSVKEVERIRGDRTSTSTLHRCLQEFAQARCPWPDLKKTPYRFLMVDGTGVALQDGLGSSLGQKEMRWALASLGVGQPFEPVGFWIGQSWSEIGRELRDRLNYQNLEVLFSDGGPGIQESLLEEGI